MSKRKRSGVTLTVTVKEKPVYYMPSELIEIITLNATNFILSYFSFIHWHRTCRQTWAYLSDSVYNEYSKKFVENCKESNFKLLKITSNGEYARNIRILESVNIIHNLIICFLKRVKESTHTMKYCLFYDTVTLVNETEWESYGIVISHNTGSLFMRKYVQILNIFSMYILTKYNWICFLVNNNDDSKKTVSIQFPLIDDHFSDFEKATMTCGINGTYTTSANKYKRHCI